MRLKMRAREARRPAIWALAALLTLVLAPAAAAKAPPAGSEGGALGSDRLSEPSAGLLALGTGFHRSGASERVREVQRKLNRLGYGAGAVDGLFGPITDAAVRRFQSDSRLAVDGLVGRQTLGQLLSRSREQERLLARGSGFSGSGGSERVRDVQQRLNRLGYGAGAVDGLFGPITDAAVRRFQSESRLAVDGVVGPRTLDALGSTTRPVRRQDASPRRSAQRPAPQAAVPARPRPAPQAVTPARPKPPAVTDGERTRQVPSTPEGTEEAPQPSDAPGSTPEETVGPRWTMLFLLVAMLGLILVLVLAFRRDRSVGRDADADWGDDGWAGDAGEAPREAEPGAEVLHGRVHVGPERPDEALPAWRTELVDVPHAGRLLGVGARADLASSPELGTDSGTVYIELQLFAEGQRRRWETDPLDGGAPFSVPVERLEEGVRAIVVPDRLPALARALRNGGVDVQPGDLETLPFMLELSAELEGQLVRRRFARPVKSNAHRDHTVSSSEGGLG